MGNVVVRRLEASFPGFTLNFSSSPSLPPLPRIHSELQLIPFPSSPSQDSLWTSAHPPPFLPFPEFTLNFSSPPSLPPLPRIHSELQLIPLPSSPFFHLKYWQKNGQEPGNENLGTRTWEWEPGNKNLVRRLEASFPGFTLNFNSSLSLPPLFFTWSTDRKMGKNLGTRLISLWTLFWW